MSLKLPAGWYAILDAHEVKLNKPFGFVRFGVALVAWRNTLGKVVVMADHCPHRKAKLSLGTVEAGTLVCPFHGFKFDSLGNCKWIPELEREASGIAAQVFPTQEKHGLIWMKWRAQEAGDEGSAHDLPWFKEVLVAPRGKKFYVSRHAVTWPIHFSRSVENQLDYAHLPFVHRTSIGRFASAPKRVPEAVITESRLKWFFPDRRESFIEFAFPNVWLNRISEKYAITLAFAPVDEGHTKLYLQTHRTYLTWPPISWIMNAVDRVLNRWILGQDFRVVNSQEPKNSLESVETLVGSDRFIIAFRKWLRSA